MTPGARVQAAIEIVDDLINSGFQVEKTLKIWTRKNRYAGSKDREEIRDLVFDALRNLRSYAGSGGGMNGRAILSRSLYIKGICLDHIFTGEGYSPAPLENVIFHEINELNDAEMYDLPDWLWPIWLTDLGEKAQSSAMILKERANLFLRVNLLKVTRKDAINYLAEQGIDVEIHPKIATALIVKRGKKKIRNSKIYQNGMVELQDASSQMTICALPSNLPGPFLDYCAGGGGKALALAAKFNSKILAHDTKNWRMSDIPKRSNRAGAEIEIVSTNYLKNKSFGLVLADAPCSGSGTWRRDPAGKWLLTEATLMQLLKTQKEIINRSSQYVRKGGILAYVTCSVLKRENSDQVTAFLSSNNNWTVQDHNQFYPSDDGDGFYYCYLLKH